jgi:hypothetical protein
LPRSIAAQINIERESRESEWEGRRETLRKEIRESRESIDSREATESRESRESI